MKRTLIVALTAVAICSLSAAAQRSDPATSSGDAKLLLKLDSADVKQANVSPDGKWLVFSRSDGVSESSSIWMALLADPKPFRITSGGYTDLWPTVSPTLDRIFFVSNRPNRGATSPAKWVMSIPIDKKSGLPTGPARQVTTDTVQVLTPTGISPDGKWLAYEIEGRPHRIRMVPTNGGKARTVLPLNFIGRFRGDLGFTADGKNLVFADSGGLMVREVSIDGGPVHTLTRNRGEGTWVGPMVGHDDRWVLLTRGANDGTWELLGKDGTSLGVASIDLRLAPSKRVDGRGVLGVKNDWWWMLRRLAIEGGDARIVSAAQPAMPFEVTASGAILSSRNRRVVLFPLLYGSASRDALTLVTTPSDGGPAKEVSLGTEMNWILGRIPGSEFLFVTGTANLKDSTASAYLVDSRTGAARLLSTASGPWAPGDPWCCYGPTGTILGFADKHGVTVDIKMFDETGATRLFRTMPLKEYRHMHNLNIHGSLMAWTDSTGPTETSVYVARGASGAPAHIGTVTVANQSKVDVNMKWSPSGRKLALAFPDGSRRDSATTVAVFDITPDGLANGSPVRLDAGVYSSYADMMWLADESAVVLLKMSPAKNWATSIVRRPLDPRQSLVTLVPESQSLNDMFLSADGRFVYFNETVRGGASIWSAEFKLVKKP